MKFTHFLHRASAVALVAAAAAGAPAFAQAADETAVADEGGSEIIVTANKREENIRDVALPISAVTGEQLARSNANSLSDYITRLPGVVFNDYQPGVSEVIIRGIAATTYHEQGQTTTGYYINEIPVVEPGFPIGIPDVDTFDLERVEVLRGPQGTLFGSSALGGLVNYITASADASKFDAKASGGIGYTKNAGEANYAARAMVNIPIIADVLAVRAVAFQRFDAGFADNTGTGVDGSNDFRVRGGRGSIVFTPGENTKISYLGMYQETKLYDQTYLTNIDDLTRVTQNPEVQETSFFLNSLRLEQNLGFATLTALGSVNKKTNTTVFDASYYGGFNGHPTGPLSPVSVGTADANIKHGEIRLASNGDGPVHAIVGISYLVAKKSSVDQTIAPGASAYINANPAAILAGFGNPFPAGTPVTGAAYAPGDVLYGYLSESKNKDFGAFGEISFKPVPEFEITVGGRYYETVARGTVTNEAGYVSGSLVDRVGGANQKENGFSPKATITFRPVDNVLAYMTYSRGYRVGGINPNAGLISSLPNSYESDNVDNYEAGVKLGLFGNKLLIDATVFNIDWNNIQAREFGPGPNFYSYVINAAGANVAGVEFSGTVKPTRNITFSSNATYQNAELTAFLPDNFGPGYASGTPLPGSSKWSVANTLAFDFPEMSVAPSLELAHRYISSAPVAFGNPTTRGDFSQFDARASITLMDKLRVMVFATNVFDKRGLLSGPFAGQNAPAFSIIRPRTVGLRLDLGL